MEITRQIVDKLIERLKENVRFIQIITGPRQVGKTTAVLQAQAATKIPSCYSSSDTAAVSDSEWIKSQWEKGRLLAKENRQALLILDEVQSVKEWQHVVKGLWDEDRRRKINLHVFITGSSALLLKKGSESLGGRFETHWLPHWTYFEMKKAFDMTFNDYLVYGGYPGAASLISDYDRWSNYVRSSLIDTVISKDILGLSRIDKPALLRQFFFTICSYPAQIVSLTKLLGQLEDAGNVTSLANYANLLKAAYMIEPLEKYSGSVVRTRGSQPKWIISNNAILSAIAKTSSVGADNLSWWGRLTENAVGQHLLLLADRVYYWRDKGCEVDYVVKVGKGLFGVEVKAGDRTRSAKWLSAFNKAFPKAKTIILGADGIPIEDFLLWDKWKIE